MANEDKPARVIRHKTFTPLRKTPNTTRIVQRAVVVKAEDSPRVPVTYDLGACGHVDGFEGGQETYPVVIAYVKTGQSHDRKKWDKFLHDNPDVRVMYGGMTDPLTHADKVDWRGRNIVQLLGADENHRQRHKRGGYCTVYRVAFTSPRALPALVASGCLRRDMDDAPALHYEGDSAD